MAQTRRVPKRVQKKQAGFGVDRNKQSKYDAFVVRPPLSERLREFKQRRRLKSKEDAREKTEKLLIDLSACIPAESYRSLLRAIGQDGMVELVSFAGSVSAAGELVKGISSDGIVRLVSFAGSTRAIGKLVKDIDPKLIANVLSKEKDWKDLKVVVASLKSLRKNKKKGKNTGRGS